MRIYTHGAKRGKIELLKSEVSLLERAVRLLHDIEAHGDTTVNPLAVAACNALDEVVQELTGKAVEV